MSDVKAELQRIATAARSQGKVTIETTAVAALARIEELEASLLAFRAGTVARVKAIAPARRREIARLAAARRWHPHASAEHPQQ
jgi:hypothetical protein